MPVLADIAGNDAAIHSWEGSANKCRERRFTNRKRVDRAAVRATSHRRPGRAIPAGNMARWDATNRGERAADHEFATSNNQAIRCKATCTTKASAKSQPLLCGGVPRGNATRWLPTGARKAPANIHAAIQQCQRVNHACTAGVRNASAKRFPGVLCFVPAGDVWGWRFEQPANVHKATVGKNRAHLWLRVGVGLRHARNTKRMPRRAIPAANIVGGQRADLAELPANIQIIVAVAGQRKYGAIWHAAANTVPTTTIPVGQSRANICEIAACVHAALSIVKQCEHSSIRPAAANAVPGGAVPAFHAKCPTNKHITAHVCDCLHIAAGAGCAKLHVPVG